MDRIISQLLLTMLIVGSFSCKKQDFVRTMEIRTIGVLSTTATSADVRGEIIDLGEGMIDYGVCYSTSPESQNGSKASLGKPAGIGNFTVELTSLEHGTQYYVRAYGFDGEEYAYGDEIDFSTDFGIPVVSTMDITEISAVNANCGGSISSDGGFAVTARGVCWSESSSPSTSDFKTIDGTGIGSFMSSLSGLNAGTKYYIRAYATNNVGTAYGEEKSFSTLDGLPIISTIEISDVTSNSAISGGVLSSNGGFDILALGVCWNTDPEPTVSDFHTQEESTSGTFSSDIIGLTELTTYYVRSYATNENGIAYGEELSFKTKGTPVSDYDGNVYQTLKIGDQIWMAENLKATHYPNGDPIPLITGNSEWWMTSGDAYCYYNNNSNSESDTYGALYNHDAAVNACPSGWHLPSSEEWVLMIATVASDGYSGSEGFALKSTSGWINNGNGNDYYGFSALPGGFRDWETGEFFSKGDEGAWWSSTGNSIQAFFVFLRSADDIVYSEDYYFSKITGFSVRCIKD